MKKRSKGSWESKKHRDYKYRDKKRGNSYAFSLEQSKALLHLPCFYCTKPLAKGLDRLNNNFGYEDGNVVPCCENCNVILSTLPQEAKMEMREALRSIHEKNLLKDWRPIYMVPAGKKEVEPAHETRDQELKELVFEDPDCDPCENCAAPSDGVSLDDVPLCDDCGENLTGGNADLIEEMSEKNFIDQQVRSYRVAAEVVNWLTPHEKDLTAEKSPTTVFSSSVCRHPDKINLIDHSQRVAAQIADWPDWKCEEVCHIIASPQNTRTESDPAAVYSNNDDPKDTAPSPLKLALEAASAEVQSDPDWLKHIYESNRQIEAHLRDLNEEKSQEEVGCEVIKQGDPKNGVYFPSLTLTEVQKLLDEGIEARREFEEKQRKLRWTKCLYCNCYMDSCVCKAV